MYNKVYKYPEWAIGLGWTLALASMICIPMVVVIKIIQSDGPLIEVGTMEITELATFKLPRCFFSLPHLLQSIPSFFPTEDQGGCGPGSRRSQLPSCQPPRPEGVTLPDGFQREQGPA